MSSSRRHLPPSEIIKQRRNLLRISGMVLKSVVDKHCFNGTLDDTDPDVKNLLVVVENILMHKYKGSSKWYKEQTPPTFWPCVATICANVKRSCVSVITEMDTSLSDMARGRIFIQMALMERRLSEYIAELLLPEYRETMLKFYELDAFLLKDEGSAFVHVCLGLNVIDFSFCPRGENLDHQYIPCIDFTPYLDFTPCEEAALDDTHEQSVLSGKASSIGEVDLDDEETAWKDKFQKLYVKYRELAQQKAYADDMLSLKQTRLEKLEQDLKRQKSELEDAKTNHAREIRNLQGVVMDLQEDISSFGLVKKMNERRRLEMFLTGLSNNCKFHESIALREIDSESGNEQNG